MCNLDPDAACHCPSLILRHLVSLGPPATPFLPSSAGFILPLPIPRPHTCPLLDDEPSYPRGRPNLCVRICCHSFPFRLFSLVRALPPANGTCLESGSITSERTLPALASSVIFGLIYALGGTSLASE